MDAPSNTKSAGLRFAEQHMQRHGWTEGKGLGKREDGRSEAIKVKVKCDTAGVGHNSAEQFTFHWWDHVFNKTASSISVEPDQDGVKVKKLSEDDGAVSSKKPRKAMLSRNMLYGRFIKSATLTSGGEKPTESSSSPDTSDSSEDEDSKLDLSSATKVSDEDLVKICGGRTAHKGARHGLTMSAKLLRIEEQERAFMEKYGKKETKLQPPKSTPAVESTEELNGEEERRIKKKKGKVHEGNHNPSDSKVPKKRKKKQKKGVSAELVEDHTNGHDQEHVPSTEEDTGTSQRKRKVPDNVEMTEELEVLSDHKNDFSPEEENSRPAKKKTECEESAMFNCHTEDRNEKAEEEAGGKSKRRKKKTECEESVMFNSHTEDRNGKSKKRKKKKHCLNEDLVKAEEQTRKAKNKKWKVDEENDPSREEEEERSRRKKKRLVEKEDEPKDEDAKATKKKKKSKDKDRRD